MLASPISQSVLHTNTFVEDAVFEVFWDNLIALAKIITQQPITISTTTDCMADCENLLARDRKLIRDLPIL